MLPLRLLIRFSALSAQRREKRLLRDQNDTDDSEDEKHHIGPDLSDQRTEEADDASSCQSSRVSVFTGRSIIGQNLRSCPVLVEDQFKDRCQDQEKDNSRSDLYVGVRVAFV